MYYIIFIFFIELTSYTIPFTQIKSNAFLYPIYIAGEFFTVTGIFIKKLRLSNYYLIFTGILSLFFLSIDKILPHYENDYSKAITNLIIICLVAYTLIHEIKNFTNKNHFLIIDAIIFLYFTVSIFIFMFQHQLIEFQLDSFFIFWVINNSMVCILYLSFIYTFLRLKK